MRSVYRISPLKDPRWNDLLNRHSAASAFHTQAWLESLRRTYNYSPCGFTTSAPETALDNAVVVCKIKSWITGSRLVSVAFADACEPLVNSREELTEIVNTIQKVCRQEHYNYLEFRWTTVGLLDGPVEGLHPYASYVYHTLALNPQLEKIFHSFHGSCIQRKIRRAEKEHLEYETGSSDDMLREFYRLLILTRRRHGLPPQPFAWFRNLRDCFGSSFRIRIAKKNREPLASILTLQHKHRLVYKYGCSDARFHHLGTMPWLFWQAIQEAKLQGLCELDLGRSDVTDHGLIAFKNHLGASQTTTTNYRYFLTGAARKSAARLLKARSCEYLPPSILRLAGWAFYRHVG